MFNGRSTLLSSFKFSTAKTFLAWGENWVFFVKISSLQFSHQRNFLFGAKSLKKWEVWMHVIAQFYSPSRNRHNRHTNNLTTKMKKFKSKKLNFVKICRLSLHSSSSHSQFSDSVPWMSEYLTHPFFFAAFCSM